MVTGHVQHCHIAVSCPITVATVKTIVILDHLPYQITQNQFIGLGDINEWWNDTDSILWLVSSAILCHMIYLPTSPQGRPLYELSYCGNLRQPVEIKILLTEKMITYKNPQSNLPADRGSLYLRKCIVRQQADGHGVCTTIVTAIYGNERVIQKSCDSRTSLVRRHRAIARLSLSCAPPPPPPPKKKKKKVDLRVTVADNRSICILFQT